MNFHHEFCILVQHIYGFWLLCSSYLKDVIQNIHNTVVLWLTQLNEINQEIKGFKNKNLLGDLVLLYVTTFAFLLPLSFEVPSKIAEKYKSITVLNLYRKKLRLNLLVAGSTSFLVGALFLELFKLDYGYWIFGFSFLTLFFIVYIVIGFYRKLDYLMDEARLLKKACNKILKKVKRRGCLTSSEQLDLRAFVDICLKNIDETENAQASCLYIGVLKEIQVQLKPENSAKGIAFILEQLEPLALRAIATNKDFIQKDIIWHLIDIAVAQTRLKGPKVSLEEYENLNEDAPLLLKDVLYKIARMRYNALKISPEYSDGIMSTLFYGTHAYFFDIIFDKGLPDQPCFDIKYLRTLLRDFTESLSALILSDHFAAFKGFVEYAHSCSKDFANPDSGYHIVSLIEQDLIRVGKAVDSALNEKFNRIVAHCNLKISELKELREQVNAYLSDDVRNSFDKFIQDWIILQLGGKKQFTLEIAFCRMFSFCLFKNRYQHFKYMLDFNQPEDSSAQWVNKEYIPRTLQSIINIFTSAEMRGYEVFEEHRSMEKYKNQAAILILAHTKFKHPFLDVREKVGTLNLSTSDSARLSEIKSYSEQVLRELNNSKDNLMKMLIDIGVINQPDDLVLEEMKRLFESVGKKVDERLEDLKKTLPISEVKKQQFFDTFMKNYPQRALKSVYLHFKKVRTVSSKRKNKVPLTANQENVCERNNFFDSWLGMRNDMGYFTNGLAQIFSAKENMEILNKLKRKAKTLNVQFIDDITNYIDLSQEWIIFVVNPVFYDLSRLASSRARIQKIDKSDHFLAGLPASKLWVEKHSEVVLYTLHFPEVQEQYVLLVNLNKMGEFVQYSLDTDSAFENDFGFSFNFIDFAKNDAELERVMKIFKWPPELKDSEDLVKKEYLKKHFQFLVSEKYVFRAKDAESYILEINLEH